MARAWPIDLGGTENLTEAQRQLIRRCAMLSVAVRIDGAGGDDGAATQRDPPTAQLTGHLSRTLNALGLKREPIDVTPALHQYLDTLQPVEPQDLVTTAED